MAFYYARELYYAGQYEACRPAMMRFVAMEHAWPTEVGEAWRIMAAIDTYPERWLWKAIAADPLRREPYCDLARAYHAKGQLLEARAVAAVASSLTDDTRYVTDLSCWGEQWDEFLHQLEGSPQ